ncbi:MAG: phosphatase PAP2 family protein [Bacilli bacterium]
MKRMKKWGMRDVMRAIRTYLAKTDEFVVLFCNSYFPRARWNVFFSNVTHLGGASFTVAISLILVILTRGALHNVALASFWSLVLSHLVVQIVKRSFKRKRPYQVLDDILIHPKPLLDASFPSGHTTAISSLLIPYTFYEPALMLIFAPIILCVGFSRMYLGMHYLTDVGMGLTLALLSSIGTYSYFMG